MTDQTTTEGSPMFQHTIDELLAKHAVVPIAVEPCKACNHKSAGRSSPPADCACRCHEPWRIFHHAPAQVKAA